MKSTRLLSTAVFCAVAMLAQAQSVPQLIHYQGRVAVGGTNFTGNGLFKFALVNNTGSATFWSNDGSSAAGSQPIVSVSLPTTNGLYAVLLGDTTLGGITLAIPVTVFTNTDVRLRIWFSNGGGFQQLAPDQRIAAVGYALMAANVAEGVITSNKLADGAVTSAKLANNAVTAGKIAGGAIFGTNLANNSVTSNQLATSQGLGSSGVNGQLLVYATAAGTPALGLWGNGPGGAGSQISTYGSDGLEQIRLWGGGYGEILLNDSTGNDTTVKLSAESNNGGSLTLNHSNNSARALLFASSTAGDLTLRSTNGATRTQLHGGSDGSYLSLYAADGSVGVFADGDDLGGGSIGLRNTNGNNRVFIDGLGNSGGGQVQLYANDGSSTLALYGDDSSAGMIHVNNSVSATRVTIDGEGAASGGEISIAANNGVNGISLQGSESGAEGAQVVMRNYLGNTTVQLDSDASGNRSGYLRLYNSNSTAKVTLEADASGDGKITCDVLQINGGSDLSEKFDIKSIHSPLKPGMIVCIDPENPGQLVTSSKAYDRTVAGIVSGAGGVKPGMLMGQAGTAADGKHPVALTGRVYCYVDADPGAIKPGDLITTSARPGHGMKVKSHDKAQGAVIGKAMSPLDKGQGLVLVLVSLQ